MPVWGRKGEKAILGKPFFTEGDAKSSYYYDGIGVLEDGTFVFGPESKSCPYSCLAPNKVKVYRIHQRVTSLSDSLESLQFYYVLSETET